MKPLKSAAVLFLAALLICGCARRAEPVPPGGSSVPAASSAPDSGDAPSEPSAPEPSAPSASDDGSAASETSGEPLPAPVTLTEAQKYTGDLILVSAEHAYHFEENEDSIGLVRILDAQTVSYAVGKPEFQLASRIMPQLDAMIADCDRAMGTDYTGISSAYRSLEYQEGVWQEIEELYGETYAKTHVAVPGCSEHHTGLAADLGIYYASGLEGSFSESENAVWMREHCGDYGFIRRYAENKTEITGIKNEAWHFRYVGLPHSVYMTENDLCLEEYLELLRTETRAEEPLRVTAGGRDWAVYYTEDPVITDPAVTGPGAEYTVSGDNVGGYVITYPL